MYGGAVRYLRDNIDNLQNNSGTIITQMGDNPGFSSSMVLGKTRSSVISII